MAKEVLIKFDCVACGAKNNTKLPKPNYGTPKTVTRECEVCDTKHFIKTEKPMGGGNNNFMYTIFDAELTAKGIEAFNERERKAKIAEAAAKPTFTDAQGIERNKLTGEVHL